MVVNTSKSKDYGKLTFFVVLVLAVAVIFGLYKLGTARQTVIQVTTPTAPSRPQQQVKPVYITTTQPKTFETLKLFTYVEDQATGDKLTGVPVDLWLVDNVTEVTSKAFYTTSGYVTWMNATTNELGRAEFDIAAPDYVADVLSDQNVKLYAVAIPNQTLYYKNGEEVPSLPYNNTLYAFTKPYVTMTIKVPKIATILDLNSFKLDFRGLTADSELNQTYTILHISPNDKGILKLYKIDLTIDPAVIANVTPFVSDMYIEVGGKKLTIIEDGQAKVTSTASLEFPVTTIQPDGNFNIRVYAKLSAAPSALVDGQTLGTISIVDVRNQTIGTVSVTLDTA